MAGGGMMLMDLARASATNRRALRGSLGGGLLLKAKDRLVLALDPIYHDDPLLPLANVIAIEAIVRAQADSDEEELAEGLLVYLLTSGVHDIAMFYREMGDEMGQPLAPAPLMIQGGLLAMVDQGDPFAHVLDQMMHDAHREVVAGRAQGFRNPALLVTAVIREEDILSAVCGFTYAVALKATSCHASSVATALTRMRHMMEGVAAPIPAHLQLDGATLTKIARLIRRSMLIRWALVCLANAIHGSHGEAWMRVVEHMVGYLQDTGMAIYTLIRDLLLINKVPALAMSMFSSDLARYKEACTAHVQHGHLGPYIKFLELPEASMFQAGRFPHLVEFMRGVASEINAQAAQLLTGTAFNLPQVYEMGVRAGRHLCTTINSDTMAELGISIESATEASEHMTTMLDAQNNTDGAGGIQAIAYGVGAPRY